ncbi:hypothetical protein C357_13390 [Citreicella sp. 357]|nr:hypothetical protein C357_13390 [Citreicella sp. 357]
MNFILQGRLSIHIWASVEFCRTTRRICIGPETDWRENAK